LNTSTIQNTVLPALINGETGQAIADKAGCSQPTISRLKSKLSSQLETFQLQLIDQAGQITVDNISTTIGRANSVLHDPNIKHKDLSEYKDLLALAHKKEVLIGQSMGILPTHTQSSVVINILNVDNRTMLSPGMSQLFNHQASDQDVEDAEYEVIE
jgi:hypothetical protein